MNNHPVKSFGISRPQAQSFRATYAALAVLVCLLSLGVFFRDTVASRFELITGNVGDNRLYIVILEHWLAVLRGEARLTSPIFFWPEPGVLGYSDCMALFLPPYATARAMGFDRYASFQGALIVTKSIGFGAMYFFLRRPLAVHPWFALLGAALFTIANAYYLAAGHAQLAAVAFVPAVGLLACAYWRNRTHARGAALLSLATCALLLALLLLTSFYIGWFTIFIGGLFGLVGAMLAAASSRSGSGFGTRAFGVGRVASDMGLALTVLLLSLGPFLRVYRPALDRLGGREFEEVIAYTPEPWHALDTGTGNLVWGSTVARISEGTDSASVFASYEFARGWPPVLLLAFVATIATSLRQTCTRSISKSAQQHLVLRTAGATAMIAWLLSLRIGRVTAWRLVFLLVPGASAIRVPARINLVVNAIVIAVAMVGLSQWKIGNRNGERRVTTAALAFITLVLVAEELNRTQIAQISRARERATFSRIGAPPASCKQFYAIKHPTVDILETAEGQIDAMLIAYDWRIPTLNGWSGNVPPGWNLQAFDTDSVRRAVTWAEARGVAKNLCVLDLTTGTWSSTDAWSR